MTATPRLDTLRRLVRVEPRPVRSSWLWPLAALAVAMGCAGARDPDGGALDAGDGGGTAGPDGGPFDGGPPRCGADRDCGAGLRCFAGTCQPDPCAAASPCDPGSERCLAACVRLDDPCAGVTCGPSETCLDGACFAGCLPAPCEGRACAPGRFCDPQSGTCRVIEPCDAECGDGAACHFTCAPQNACDGVTCAEDELCRDGACVQNPCFGIDCAPGEICQNGICNETCNCEPPCSAPERCIVGRCTCVPHCPAGAACGAPDGCGGFCPGACPGPNDECDPSTGACRCAPRCPAGAACGADDGCGGRCAGPCPGAESCIGGACECTDVCVSAGGIACGESLPSTCAGSACAGVGTQCAAAAECRDNQCCGSCLAVFAVACGEPVPDVLDATGAVCRDCVGLGVRCSGGQSCLLSADGSSRVCCGLCADPASVPCGQPIPDARDASGAVCRVCSLAYGTGCPSGERCTGGPRGVCCPDCASPSEIDCGDPIPNESCRTCTGVGDRCPAGTSCAQPPGTTAGSDRECCASCTDPAGVACGSPIAPVLGADGSVCRTCAAGSMCPSTERCHDGSCCTPSCAPASARACGSTEDDGCGGRCPPGERCAGPAETCTGDPPACACLPSCMGRRCGLSDGCGAECMGPCDPGFVCAERSAGNFDCVPSDCAMSCGLCEACVLGRCEPLACGAGQSPCLTSCECCGPTELCTAAGCAEFG